MQLFVLLLLLLNVWAKKGPIDDDNTVKDNADLAHLQKRLLGRYRYFRPNFPNSSQIYVTAFLNQARNTIKVSGGLRLLWKDEKLMWNPFDFDGITQVFVPHRKIWTPELQIWYSVKVKPLKSVDSEVKLTYNGYIHQVLSFTSETFCGIDVKKFPFDEQNCRITIGSEIKTIEEFNFTTTLGVDLDNFYDNQEHILLNASVRADSIKVIGYREPFAVLYLNLITRRQPFYYVFILVVPTFLITLIALIAFHCADSSKGPRSAKFQIGTITLLSMSVILVGFSSQLPKFSLTAVPGNRGSFSAVPLLGIYYISLLFLIMAGTVQNCAFVLLERCLLSSNRMRNMVGFMKVSSYDSDMDLINSRHAVKALSSDGTAPVQGIDRVMTSELNSLSSEIRNIRRTIDRTTRRGADEEARVQHVEMVVRRLEIASFIFFMSILGIIMLMLFYNDWY